MELDRLRQLAGITEDSDFELTELLSEHALQENDEAHARESLRKYTHAYIKGLKTLIQRGDEGSLGKAMEILGQLEQWYQPQAR